jgi:hypothetical protein
MNQVARSSTSPGPETLPPPGVTLSRKFKFTFTAIMLSIVIAVTLIFFELAVRFIVPQPQLYPRYRYSERFGHLFPESATIVNEMPGVWRFVYHTNEYGYRVSMPEISSRYDRPNIVVLGDSFTFGIGVNDGEEYPAVLAKLLGGEASVVNLGMGSFGLTHQIRTFYEFGLLFEPALVVLQFSANDPDDNFYEMITTVEDGRFRFHRDRSMGGGMSRVKDWLSGSVLQRSSAYNFLRNYAYTFWYRNVVEHESAGGTQRKEAFHNQLLTAFAEDLRRRGIPLILFDVPGHLAHWPEIRTAAEALNGKGLLRYLLTDQWFDGVTDYGTPEGHPWGAKGHRIVAEHLVARLHAALAEGKSPHVAR